MTATGYVLYNLRAGFETQIDSLYTLKEMMSDKLVFQNIQEIDDFAAFFEGLSQEDYIILCGGDGTINRFINLCEGINFNHKILYFPTGTGNDFATDLGYTKGCQPFEINDYLKDLPFVAVNGETHRFLNGIGYGIDGYCCEVGDELKKIPGKKINYTAIAIKGLLFYFKPVTAKVSVDGKVDSFRKVWIAPTMNGRFYGGGMMPIPTQDRLNKEKTVSLMLFHGTGKLKTLMIFPSIFKGTHVKHEEAIWIRQGHEISVEFDRPVALQIDGETHLNVTSYSVCTAKKAAEKAELVTAKA